MTDHQIAEIAGKLTKAQRAYLLDAYYGPQGWKLQGFRSGAVKSGLCHPRSAYLTSKGIAVRQYLLNQEGK